ncbi:hypothetical protein CASFOL_016073 [Castilleja foliolosa]|uniref:Magnesium transporter n=1 Tax=Castilleja foliolosa TaxID=1961234 RepID=A0ABD3DFI2_9LAMI
MILVQFTYVGMSILSKATITRGMNLYRQVFSREKNSGSTVTGLNIHIGASMFSKASSYESVCVCRLSTSSCRRSFGSLRVLSRQENSGSTVINFIIENSPGFYRDHIEPESLVLCVQGCICNVCNSLNQHEPSYYVCLSYVLQESLSKRQTHGVVKVIASAISLLGALICTFAGGPALYSDNGNANSHLSEQSHSKRDWVVGSFIVLAANSAWCLWLIMAPSKPIILRLVALQCFFSCLWSAVWAYANERNLESWKIDYNINLFSIIYIGVVINAIMYWLQVWVAYKKGPVFTGSLALVITATLLSVPVSRDSTPLGKCLWAIQTLCICQ